MTRPAPVYEHPPTKVNDGSIRGRRLVDLIENLFFAVTTGLTFAFGVVLLRESTTSLVHVSYLVLFWAAMAYLALPRLHRILTTMYVPDYFIGRARTTDGLLGDPVNLAFTGSAEQIHAAMQRAGWVLADPVDLTSSARIVSSSLSRRSYPEAPVSPLLLFGEIQAFAYQQEVEGNPAQRHHVRFWPCPEGWLLPGGHQVDWLAAGTYDRSVGLSLFTLQVTHKIDRDIDVERDYIVDTVAYAVPESSVTVIEDFSTGYHHRNGGGDAVATDGDLPVVDVSHVTDLPEELVPEPLDALHDVGRRPFSIIAAVVLGAIALGVTVGISVVRLAAGDVSGVLGEGVTSDLRTTTTVALLAYYLVIVATFALLAWKTYLGRRWARLCLVVLLTVTLMTEFAQAFSNPNQTLGSMLSLSADLLTIYALTSLSARQWTSPRRHAGVR
ncbi:LssY C-terminal domain-containing protein [Arsenicicoccus bolidensis]|uniref:LssY C-terminal domain-containing protein n=1 Tax=Arsenicicoccus bolidensis TaxID=229480 RepID=UPI000427B218|nr:LssY C-terminal domain-containing protein [Arsenicicoccus bolidensis]